MVRGHALFQQVGLDAFHAALGQLYIVVFGSANVGVAFENQLGVWSVLQIILEVTGERIQRGLLAGQQTAHGLGHRGQGCREIDAVQRQLGFQLLDLRRLRGLVHFHIAGSICSSAAAIVHRTLQRVGSRLQPGGIKVHIRAASHDLSAGCGVAVRQGIVIRIAAVAGDAGAFTRKNGGAFHGECRRGWMIGLLFNLDVHRARGRAAFAVIHFHIYGEGANGYAGGIPARLRAGAFYNAASRGIYVRQGIVIRIAGVHMHGHVVTRTGKNGRGTHRTRRHRQMIRRRGRIGNPKTQNQASAGAEAVLPAGGC